MSDPCKIWDTFCKFESEHLEHEKIENMFSTSPDIHAMMVLSALGVIPKGRFAICSGSRDVIYFHTDEEALGKVPEHIILDLVRCGVFYSQDDGLYMFI